MGQDFTGKKADELEAKLGDCNRSREVQEHEGRAFQGFFKGTSSVSVSLGNFNGS